MKPSVRYFDFSLEHGSCPFKPYTLNISYCRNINYIAYLIGSIKPHLADTAMQYPHFNTWFSKVSIELLYGFRSIIFIYHNDNIAAFSILKHSESEKKICTFYTSKKYRRNNIGNLLMYKSLSLLGHGNALITMPDRKVDEFLPLLRRHRFIEQSRKMNYYTKNEEEYFFTHNSMTPPYPNKPFLEYHERGCKRHSSYLNACSRYN